MQLLQKACAYQRLSRSTCRVEWTFIENCVPCVSLQVPTLLAALSTVSLSVCRQHRQLWSRLLPLSWVRRGICGGNLVSNDGVPR